MCTSWLDFGEGQKQMAMTVPSPSSLKLDRARVVGREGEELIHCVFFQMGNLCIYYRVMNNKAMMIRE
jgi:hypothetical protein